MKLEFRHAQAKILMWVHVRAETCQLNCNLMLLPIYYLVVVRLMRYRMRLCRISKMEETGVFIRRKSLCHLEGHFRRPNTELENGLVVTSDIQCNLDPLAQLIALQRAFACAVK